MQVRSVNSTGVWILLPLLMISGCATNIPSEISQAPAESISASQVQASSPEFEGRRVRWGGEIIKVINEREVTDVEVLGKALSSNGKPQSDSAVDARFVARIQGFVDPADYVAGKRLTVSGTVSGLDIRKVGEYEYPYPVVIVDSYHMWPREKQKVYCANCYDPWPYYGPWGWYRYPYGRYPYWWY